MRGWIALHRQFATWEWFTDPAMVQLFIYLLLSATHDDTQWRGIAIKRGQIITSLEKMSAATGLSVRKIRTCINRLISTCEIACETTNKYTIITICNYDKYQDREIESDTQNDTQADKQATNKRQTNDKQTTSPIIFNNNNNNNNYNKISLCRARASAREGEREKVFKIFFLKNFVDPLGEVQRFYDNYEAQGWVRGNGQEITDVLAVARTWEPKEKEKRRFPESFIEALREIDKIFAERGWESLPMLMGIDKVDFTADCIVVYCERQAAETIEGSGTTSVIQRSTGRSVRYRVRQTN